MCGTTRGSRLLARQPSTTLMLSRWTPPPPPSPIPVQICPAAKNAHRHTKSSKHMSPMSPLQAASEMTSMLERAFASTGATTEQYQQPPHGLRLPMVQHLAQKSGSAPVSWSRRVYGKVARHREGTQGLYTSRVTQERSACMELRIQSQAAPPCAGFSKGWLKSIEVSRSCRRQLQLRKMRSILFSGQAIELQYINTRVVSFSIQSCRPISLAGCADVLESVSLLRVANA